ncbi:hypothetical protein ACFYW6_25070 [Streptomyces sp. NPDC002659]|uniref:hypothetical protein n=1 Tax=Streptomyces sp. NPDC002659 TaxID=3364656 RepID=UPI00368D70B8
MDETLWAAISAITGVIGNIAAMLIATASMRRADLALSQAQEIADRAVTAHYNIDGATAAVAWREQVIALHDRGLSPEQIRHIMLLEDGGEGYERSNGRIDAILAGIPRQDP